MTDAQTSQGFVRALKAASDPPIAGGPFKIEIARRAWDDASFHVPCKSEVVADWVLTKFMKERTRGFSANPLIDIRYWKLLLDVISSQDNASQAQEGSTSRLPKTWLSALLLRIPISVILLSFLTLLKEARPDDLEQLISVVHSCLFLLWPVGLNKMNTELLLDCWGTFLQIFEETGPTEGFSKIGALLSKSYRNSLAISSGKKKMYSTFVQSYLPHWLKCIESPINATQDAAFHEIIFSAGAETLFNLEILRQSQDVKVENTIFDAFDNLGKSHKPFILEALPKLFSQYIQSISKYRSALFGQGSQQQAGTALNQLHAAGMGFFTSCQVYLDETDDHERAWTTRAALLDIVEEENLFDRTLDVDRVFNRSIEASIAILASEQSLDQTGVITLSLRCLTAIARIDHDLIVPSIPRIFSQLICISAVDQDQRGFLELMIDYYTKTRTMDIHLENLFACLLSSKSESCRDCRQRYQIGLSSPILHPLHLTRLSKALKFLTPNQCLPSLKSAFEILSSIWHKFKAADHQKGGEQSKGSVKKKETVGKQEYQDMDPESVAVTYCLVARLASTLLFSLPTQSLPPMSQEKVRECIEEFRASFLQKTLSKVLKLALQDSNTWPAQVIAAATLQVQYTLDRSTNVALSPNFDSKLSKKMMNALEDDELLPELSLEIFRHHLHYASAMDASVSQVVVEKFLLYLERSFTPSDVVWSGQPHHLTFGQPGKAECALALLHLILERWLPTVEILATPEQLTRLLKVIMRVKIPLEICNLEGQLRPEHLLLRTLHSAEFWELHIMRNVFLAHLDEITAFLDEDSSDKLESSQISDITSVYRLLLFSPPEYFTKTSRSDLVRRALKADSRLSHLSSSSDELLANFEALSIIRVFLKRIALHIGSNEQSPADLANLILRLLDQEKSNTPFPEFLTTPTLDLIDLYFLSCCKTQTELLTKIFVSYSHCKVFENPASIRARCFIRMIDILVSEFELARFTDDIRTTIRKLHVHQAKYLLQSITSNLIDDATSSRMIDEAGILMAGWRSLLALGHWLEQEDSNTTFIGRRLVSRVLALIGEIPSRSGKLDSICVATFSILLEEFHFCSDDQKPSQIDFAVATYTVFCPVMQQLGQQQSDKCIGKICKVLSPTDFSHVLGLVSNSLSAAESSPNVRAQLVHLATVLLRDHPQNTLKYTQAFATQCIHTFLSQTTFTSGPILLRQQVLDFIAQHCSDRPTALRPLDIGGIWSLLCKFLAPSDVHDAHSSIETFHKIIAITSSIIRLRRDLVTPTLPHLGMVLRRLLLTTRACRPSLGAKQTNLVMDTQPRWINKAQPLGPQEGKALARVLETLNTKTTVRTHSSLIEVQKAESLAKPFSKHAAYVLKAYIEAMNDPLCALPLEMRKGLYPGLFALCSTMNDHSRDAMMVSGLDAGGKATMKSLWKEYERQRYVGKG